MTPLLENESGPARRRMCARCKAWIPNPYPLPSRRVALWTGLCSTCDAAEKWEFRQNQLAQEHRKLSGLGPARCVCGFLLPECKVATCLPVKPLELKPPKPPKGQRQGKLF